MHEQSRDLTQVTAQSERSREIHNPRHAHLYRKNTQTASRTQTLGGGKIHASWMSQSCMLVKLVKLLKPPKLLHPCHKCH
jgi:hypothetical protein